jgi:hypothetical protein
VAASKDITGIDVNEENFQLKTFDTFVGDRQLRVRE